MKCTVLHALRDHPGVWLSPTSALTARLIAGPVSAFMRQMETSEPEDEFPVLLPGEDGPAALWIGNGSAGHRLAPAADLYGWREALEIATTPADLGGALLLWSLDDVEQLAGLGLLDAPFAELLAAAEETTAPEEWTAADRRLAFAILTARAQAEAQYATARAQRIAKRAAKIAAMEEL